MVKVMPGLQHDAAIVCIIMQHLRFFMSRDQYRDPRYSRTTEKPSPSAYFWMAPMIAQADAVLHHFDAQIQALLRDAAAQTLAPRMVGLPTINIFGYRRGIHL